MLSILEPITVAGGTAYRDDREWHRFYIVPSMPRVRRREDGAPAFLLVIYAFGDDDRAEDPSLPRGAGYLQFDVVLALEDTDAVAARQALQQRVDAEYARRKTDPAFATDPRVLAPAPPLVEISDPIWSGGSVRFQTTQVDTLITHRVAEQPAALLTGNTACFNMDLSEAGVSFFKQLLVTDTGVGRVDLSAVQVVYSLKMWARLPDFTVTLATNSERLQTVHEKVKTTNADEMCTPAEVETFQQSGFSASQLQASGVIEFHTDAPAHVPEQAITAVRDYAYQLFDSMVREQFLAPVDALGEPLAMDDGITPQADNAAVAWLYPSPDFQGAPVELRGDADGLGNVLVRSVQLRLGHKVTLYPGSGYSGAAFAVNAGTPNVGGEGIRVSSVRATRPPETRVKVRNVENSAEFNLSIRLSQSQVVEWGVAPGSSLEPVFAGLPASQMKKHVVEMTLDGFRARPVTVRVFTDYERIQAVVVSLEYSGIGADGRPVEKEAAHTFTGAEPAPFVVDWTQIGSSRSYRYRYATIEAGTFRRSVDSPWITTQDPQLDISVVEPGRIELEVSGAALEWPFIRLCTVAMRVPLEDGTFVDHTLQLTPAAPNGIWRVSLGQNPAGPIALAYEFVLGDGRTLGPIQATAEVGQNLIVVKNPNIDVLNVTVVPGGDWSEVAVAVVVLRYQETDGTVSDNSFRLTSVEQLVEWRVPLRDAQRRDFTWEVTITWKTDQPPEIRPPKAASGDQTIAVVVTGRPKLEVTVNPALLDFTTIAAVQVNLTAASGATTSCAFSKGATNSPFVWKLPLAPGAAATWSWESIAYTTNGEELRSGVQPGAGNLLLVPRPTMPEATGLSIQVRGNFVNFTATPLVAVELRAGPPGNERSHTIEIDASNKSGAWALALPPGAPRRFSYTINYFLANGTPVSGESGTSESPLLVIKAHTPL